MDEDQSYPRPVSDPAAEGLPEHADHDSHADEALDAPRAADGPDPAILPREREDGPLAIDEYGTTPWEMRHGEPMDVRLSREMPDRSPDSAGGYGSLEPDDPPDADPLLAGPVDPHLDSVVSMYDRDEPGLPPHQRVGRLVAPDEGSHEDTEATEVARDAGTAGGGASAEELAVHPVPEDRLD
jgi:hypothetical protein